MKTCSKCSKALPEDRYYKRRERGGELYKHCKVCHFHMTKAWIDARPETRRAYCRGWGKRLRIRALVRVAGSLHPVCACCREDEIQFLTIDHINGGGTKESETYGNHREFYQAILRGTREIADLQILCANCNTAKGRYGGVCPHKKKPTRFVAEKMEEALR